MGTHGGAAIHKMPGNQILDERLFESDSSHFSSPISSPTLGSAFLPVHEPTLGVYFEPADGEKNDVLAALRATRRINKQALDVVQVREPRRGSGRSDLDVRTFDHERSNVSTLQRHCNLRTGRYNSGCYCVAISILSGL